MFTFKVKSVYLVNRFAMRISVFLKICLPFRDSGPPGNAPHDVHAAHRNDTDSIDDGVPATRSHTDAAPDINAAHDDNDDIDDGVPATKWSRVRWDDRRWRFVEAIAAEGGRFAHMGCIRR